jgi:putative ABC transport system substrate-binding protein
MRRREFISLVGGATVVWPLAARAQQAVMPVIGFLHAGSLASGSPFMAVFRRTLREAGYVEHQNVVIEDRYADGQYERLPEFAAELIRLQVKVIITTPNTNAARAAKAATNAIPIIFMVSDDPVKLGVVTSLSHPGGNATGVNFLISELVAKRLGVLRELLPSAARIAALVNPKALTTEAFIKDVKTAASAIGIP